MIKNLRKEPAAENIKKATKNVSLPFVYHFVPSVHKVSNDFITNF